MPDQPKKNPNKAQIQSLINYRQNFREIWNKEQHPSQLLDENGNIKTAFSLINISPKVIEFLSHELKTPLNVILIFTKLLLEKDELLSVKEQDYIKNILKAGNEIHMLINDLVMFNQINIKQHKALFLEKRDLLSFFEELRSSQTFGTIVKIEACNGDHTTWLSDYSYFKKLFTHLLKLTSLLNFPESYTLFTTVKTGEFCLNDEKFTRVLNIKLEENYFIPKQVWQVMKQTLFSNSLPYDNPDLNISLRLFLVRELIKLLKGVIHINEHQDNKVNIIIPDLSSRLINK